MFVATMQRLVHYAGGEQTAAPPAPSNWPRSALRWWNGTILWI